MHTVQLKDLPSTPIPLDSVIDTAIVRLSRVWCAGQHTPDEADSRLGAAKTSNCLPILFFVPSCCTQPVPYTPRKFQRTCARKSIAPCHTSHIRRQLQGIALLPYGREGLDWKTSVQGGSLLDLKRCVTLLYSSEVQYSTVITHRFRSISSHNIYLFIYLFIYLYIYIYITYIYIYDWYNMIYDYIWFIRVRMLSI